MEPARDDLLAASGGRYRTVKPLREGGTAQVLLVEEHPGQVLRVADGHRFRARPDSEGWRRLEAAYGAWQSVRHPGVPRLEELLRYESAGGVDVWIIEEYVPSESLQALVDGHGAAPMVNALEVARALLVLLSDLHARTPMLIHGNVKPSNVLLRPDGTVALVDPASVEAALRRCATGEDALVASPGYTAPEQVSGVGGPRVDLYGVGATLFFLVTGHTPTGKTPAQREAAVLAQGDGQGEAVVAVLERLMAGDPGSRPGTASDALLLVREALGGHVNPTQAAPEAEGEVVGPGEGVVCPACSAATDVVRVGGGEGEVDRCGACGGRWLDHGELGMLVRRPVWLRPDLPRIRAAIREMRRVPDPVAYRRCPRCAHVMNRVNFAGVSGVIVDECASHGVWLDRGELEAIREFVTAGGMEIAEERARERAAEDARRVAESRSEWRRMPDAVDPRLLP